MSTRFPYYLPAALIALAGVATASRPAPASLSSDGSRFRLTTPDKTVTIEALSADLFRVTAVPNGSDVKFFPSKSVVEQPFDANAISIAYPDSLLIVTQSTLVSVDRTTGKVTFRSPDGKTLIAEASPVDNASDVKSAALVPAPGQLLYGGGERGHSLRINGDSLTMYNRQNYGYTEGDPRISQMGISVPWISSDAGYGILFDDYNKALLTTGDTIRYTSKTPRPISYYFVNGRGSLAGNSEGFSNLTGHQDLPPFWTLGYITSKYGYHNREETLGAVDSLKRRGYPLDGIVLDLYWYGIETDMGRLEWDRVQFPAHRQMLDSLKKQGVNTVLISQPYINKIGALDNYNLLDSLGLLTHDSDGATHDVTTWVGEAGMFDMANPSTRKWLWNRLKPLTEEGVAGWWGDLGEPEVHPATIVHANGQTAEQYHNVYGNDWSATIYDGLRRDFPEMRPLLMMRGGTAGLQRYSVFPWTTDVSRSWGGLQPQVKLMLSSGLSGLGYMSSDIGGFAVDPEHPYDPELYVRWMQAGVFSPVLRTHAQQKPEPYHYPNQQKIILDLVKMRYRWLPYNYTLAYENASQGLPLARPLNFRGENPGKKYADISDEYLWGDNVLVAPVMKQGARSRKVLFPAGEWYDWENPRLKYKGGSEALIKAPLDRLPLFVKAGSFIPQYERAIQNTTEYDPQFLTIKYFPSSQPSDYILFDDDRKSPTSLSDGAYQLTRFSTRKEGKVRLIEVSSEGRFENMPESRIFTFEIQNVTAKPKKVEAGNTSLEEQVSPKAIRQQGWSYDRTSRTLYIKTGYDYSPLTIAISD